MQCHLACIESTNSIWPYNVDGELECKPCGRRNVGVTAGADNFSLIIPRTNEVWGATLNNKLIPFTLRGIVILHRSFNLTYYDIYEQANSNICQIHDY